MSANLTIEDTLAAILDQLQQLNQTLLAGRSGSVSSVEVKTSTRGTDITCKAYTDSDIEPAGNAATVEYRRVMALLEGRVMDGFVQELGPKRA